MSFLLDLLMQLVTLEIPSRNISLDESIHAFDLVYKQIHSENFRVLNRCLGIYMGNINVIDGGNRVPHFNSFSNVACRRLEFFKPYSRAINLHATPLEQIVYKFPSTFFTRSSPAIFAIEQSCKTNILSIRRKQIIAIVSKSHVQFNVTIDR